MHHFFLAVAIVLEVVATTALKASAGFTRAGPSVLAVVGYVGAFYLLSLALRSIPVALAYAIWAGAGVALVTLAAWIALGERLDGPAIAGVVLIVAGVLTIYLLSDSVSP